MSKRIVIACFGSYGDLFPYLGLACRLKALGHEPVLATSLYYEDLVRREGVAFRAVRPNIDPADTALLARVMDPAKGSEVIIRELVAMNVRDAFADLRDVAQGADLIVTHPLTFAGRLVAEVLKLPWLSTVLAPTSMFSVHDFPIFPPYPAVTRWARSGPPAARLFMRFARLMTSPWTAPVRAFRRELGLAPAADPVYAGQYSPHGTLAMFSSVLGTPQADWPPNTTQTGFVFHDGPGELSADLLRFLEEGDPPVVFTLGTSAVGAAGAFYEESLEAVERLQHRAVFLVGRDPRNRTSRVLPRSVLAIEYAPHTALFPRAAAIVHHGGVGTTAQALRAGHPMLVVPHAHDQPDNALRVVQLGVARTEGAHRYRAARAAAHLGALLTDRRYRDRARTVGQAVSAENGVEVACDAIMKAAR